MQGAALPSYTTALLYFAGFFIRWDAIPVYWKWAAVTDYLRYTWGALMVNQVSWWEPRADSHLGNQGWLTWGALMVRSGLDALLGWFGS